MNGKQYTIQNEVKFQGRGLHTGEDVTICLKPAGENAGVVFQRIDLPQSPRLRVGPDSVRTDHMSGRCSIIGQGEAAVQTIEHLMAALHGLGVDNVVIEINGAEVPGLDGSAQEFAQGILQAGLLQQQSSRRYLSLKRPITVSAGQASITMVPAEDFRITYTLDYDHPALRSQVFNFTLGEDDFMGEVAPARTFCLKQEAEALQKAGLGKGADYKNTLVMDESGPVENELRLAQECARHKVLDLIGDLAFAGRPLKGHVFAVRSGHYLNACLVKAIADQVGDHRFPVDGTAAPQQAVVDISGIMDMIPHRYPFLLVDRIVEIEEGKRAVGIKNLTMNELFFQGHFPQAPIMPGVLMIEAMAQVGGILLRQTELHQNQLGLFMAVNNTKFRRTAHPGDQLVMEIEVLRDRARMASVHGTGRVDGQVVVEADMMFSFMDAEKIFG